MMDIHDATIAMLDGFPVRRPDWPTDHYIHHIGFGRFLHSFQLPLSPDDISADDWEKSPRLN